LGGKIRQIFYITTFERKKSPDYHKSKREDEGKVILKEISGEKQFNHGSDWPLFARVR
jgi:hypothetical protein